jgi:hypothetical protein
MIRDRIRGYRDEDTLCVKTYGAHSEMKEEGRSQDGEEWRVAGQFGQFNHWKPWSAKDTVTVTFERS